jgi:hypothetical protein
VVQRGAQDAQAHTGSGDTWCACDHVWTSCGLSWENAVSATDRLRSPWSAEFGPHKTSLFAWQPAPSFASLAWTLHRHQISKAPLKVDRTIKPRLRVSRLPRDSGNGCPVRGPRRFRPFGPFRAMAPRCDHPICGTTDHMVGERRANGATQSSRPRLAVPAARPRAVQRRRKRRRRPVDGHPQRHHQTTRFTSGTRRARPGDG